MKEILQQLSLYSIWANRKIIDTILTAPEEKWTMPLSSSFSSLEATLLHIWDAESIWWQRLKLEEFVVPPSVNFSGGTPEICRALLQQQELWKNWIDQASIPALEHVFAYQNSRREQFKQPVYQVLFHLFNHATYHRGQLVTMLRQAGITKIPQTDFIHWTRTRGKL